MLVATAAQTASYPLHATASSNSSTSGGSNGVNGNGVANKKICLASSTTNSNASNSITNSTIAINNNNNDNDHRHRSKLNESSTKSISNYNAASAAASTASALMKTFSVRLNRGTEFLKSSVQKALVSTTTSSSYINSGSSSSIQQPQHSHSYHVANNRSTTTTVASSTTSSSTSVIGSGGAGGVGGGGGSSFGTCGGIGASLTTAASRIAVAAVVLATARSSATASATAQQLHKLYTVPPTVIHRYPQKDLHEKQPKHRTHASSADSLQREMCHFKPIRAAPTTRWKCGSRSRGGATLRTPQAQVARQQLRQLNLNCDEANEQPRAGALANETIYRPKPGPTIFYKSLTTTAQQPHRSAFVCLMDSHQVKILAGDTANDVNPSCSNVRAKPKASPKIKSQPLSAKAKRGGTTAVKKRSKKPNTNSKRTSQGIKPVARSSAAVAVRKTPIVQLRVRASLARKLRDPLLPVKQRNSPNQLILNRSVRSLRSNTALNMDAGASPVRHPTPVRSANAAKNRTKRANSRTAKSQSMRSVRTKALLLARPSSRQFARPASRQFARPASRRVARSSSQLLARAASQLPACPASQQLARPASRRFAKPQMVDLQKLSQRQMRTRESAMQRRQQPPQPTQRTLRKRKLGEEDDNVSPVVGKSSRMSHAEATGPNMDIVDASRSSGLSHLTSPPLTRARVKMLVANKLENAKQLVSGLFH